MTKPPVTELTLDLDGAPLTLRWVRELPRYVHEWVAERGGVALTIALQQTTRRTGEAGADEPYVKQTRGPVADLGQVARALHDVSCAIATSGAPIDVHCQWGHFRQNRWGHVTFTLSHDVVEVEAVIDEQDDSYY